MAARTPHLSPASSIMSLPSTDLSDLDDSDFDIISSSGSARSHDGEAHIGEESNYSEDETDHSIEPSSLLLDREWYGVIDPTRGYYHPLPASSDVPVGSAPVADEIAYGATNINSPAVLSVEDVDSIDDVLSQSLERSSESLKASTATPVGASYANLHFVTSPSGTARRASTVLLSRSKLLEAAPSPSSSVLQLAFPDPLPAPAVEESVASAPVEDVSPPIAVASDPPATITESPKASFPTAPELAESVITAASEKLEKTESISISEEEAKDIGTAEGDAETELTASMRAAFAPPEQRFDALDICVNKLSEHILNTISGNRWTTSVVVSILAIVISGAAYMGGSPASPSPTPSFITPSSTFWGLLQPFNRSFVSNPSAIPPTQPHNPFASGTVRDVPLSMFAPWSFSPGTPALPVPQQPNYFTAPRGLKRNKACEHTATTTLISEPAPIKSVQTPTIDSPAPTLLIDAPRAGVKPTEDSTMPALSEEDTLFEEVTILHKKSEQDFYTPYHEAMEVALTDSMKVVNELLGYLAPAASSLYNTVTTTTDDLVKALDELLLAIQTQTIILSSTLAKSSPKFATVVETIKGEATRVQEEISYRHSRAKDNARRIREKVRKAHAKSGKKAAKVVDTLKRGVTESSSYAKKFAEDAQAMWEGVDLKEEISNAVEDMKEGLKQSMRVKKRETDSFASSAGSSGNPKGRIVSHFAKEGERSKRQSASNPVEFMSRIVGRHDASVTHGGGKFKKSVRQGNAFKRHGAMTSRGDEQEGPRRRTRVPYRP